MNIAKVLKAEISRIARKEARALNMPIRRASLRMRPDLAATKARMAVLEAEVKRLTVLVINLASTQPAAAAADDPEGKLRMTGKGIKTLRGKLGLTQGELARLAGVSSGAVTLWERKPGTLKLREATRKSLLAIKSMGKKNARQRLESLPAKKAVAVKQRKRT